MSNPACGETGTPWAALAPLYAAGFVGAFGATGIATMLAGHTVAGQVNLFTLGLLLAAYPAAVVLLKSVFAAWANRVGTRPVLLGGLTAFALASVSFAVAGNPVLVGVARFAQGAAAAAFYPAATITVAHLSRTAQPVRAFSSHAAWSTLGFMLGPVLGGAIATVGGDRALFAVLGLLATVVAGWSALAVPAVTVPAVAQQPVVDAARRRRGTSSARSTAALTGTVSALVVAAGFLPALGIRHGLGPATTGAIVSELIATGVLAQACANRIHRAGRVAANTLAAIGLLLAATGFAITALLPGSMAMAVGAPVIGAGAGLAWPAARAGLSRTGIRGWLAASLAPIFVGTLSAATTLDTGSLAMTVLLAAAANLVVLSGPGRAHVSVSPTEP